MNRLFLPAFPRSGTTFLFHILKQHPDIEFYRNSKKEYVKEPNTLFEPNKYSYITKTNTKYIGDFTIKDFSQKRNNINDFYSKLLTTDKILLIIRNPIIIDISVNLLFNENYISYNFYKTFKKKFKKIPFISIIETLNNISCYNILFEKYINNLDKTIEEILLFLNLDKFTYTVSKSFKNDFFTVINYLSDNVNNNLLKKQTMIHIKNQDIFKYMYEQYYEDIVYISKLFDDETLIEKWKITEYRRIKNDNKSINL